MRSLYRKANALYVPALVLFAGLVVYPFADGIRIAFAPSHPDWSGRSVAELAAADCALFLWATDPMLPQALDLMAAWGFQYKTVAFTWAKTTKAGDGWARKTAG